MRIDQLEESLDVSVSPRSLAGDSTDEITNPVLFIIPGLTDESQKGMIVNMVDQAQSEGYDVVVINYRGLAGASLYTPKLYSANNIDDHLEAMTFIYEKYCKPYNRQTFAIGLSTGANKVAHFMAHVGSQTFVSAASIVCTCSDLNICIDELEKPINWFYRNWVID